MSLSHIDFQHTNHTSPIKKNKYYFRENGSLTDLKNIQSASLLQKSMKDTSIFSVKTGSQTKISLNSSRTNLRAVSQKPAASSGNLSTKQTLATEPAFKKFQFEVDKEINMEKVNSEYPPKKSYAEQVRKQPQGQKTKSVKEFERYMMTPMSGTPKCFVDFQSKSAMKTTLSSLKLPKINNHNEKIEATVDSINDELQKYKNLHRIVEVDGFYDKGHDLKVSMLSKTINSPHTLPRNLGINKSLINDKRKINISSQFIGDRYSEMASEAFKHEDLERVESVKLKDNNLTSVSLQKLVQNLPKNIQKLNLSENVKLGKEGVMLLAPILTEKKYNQLRVVNLENTSLFDDGALVVIQSLLNSTIVSVLNISRNSITDAIGPQLGQLIETSDSLQELYLHWNKFTAQTGCNIADALKTNNNLMVLDLSFNGLGSHFGLSSKMCGKKLFDSLNRPKCNMRHLDLSYNNFTIEEGFIIQQVIKANDGVTGFHFEGNCQDKFYVDSRGFLSERKVEEDFKEQLHLKRKRIQGVKFIAHNRLQNDRMSMVDNCWICDGWVEVQFIVEGLSECTFLHVDFDGYRPICMEKMQDGKFVYTKMCPPKKKIRFFFTDPTQYVAFSSESFSKEKQALIHNNAVAFKRKQQLEENTKANASSLAALPELNEDIDDTATKTQPVKSTSSRRIPTINSMTNINDRNSKSKNQKNNQNTQQNQKQKQNKDKKVFFDTMQQLIYNEGTGMYTIVYQDGTAVDYEMPEYFNTLKTDINKSVFSKYKDIQILSYPRVAEKVIQLSAKPEWVYEKSIFKDFIKDTEDLLDKCFEFDFSQSRIAKMISDKEDLAKVKALLRQNYRKIKRNYKLYSSYASGEIFCIAQNILSQFAIRGGIVDSKFSFADLDYNMIATSSQQKNNYLNPDKVLIRFKFMEIFVRIAYDKYVKYGNCKKYSEALQELLNEPTLKESLDFAEDPQEWRNTKFWNEGCDIILKQNQDLAKVLWNQFADSRKTEKRSFMNYKTMNLSEFRDFINYFNFIDSSFNERDINIVFNMSMQTVIDEVTQDKHLLMNYNEFLEAISRVAELRIFKEEEENEEIVESESEPEESNKEDEEEDDDKSDYMYDTKNEDSSRYNSKRNSGEQNLKTSSLAHIKDDFSEDDDDEEVPTRGKTVMFVKQKTIEIDQFKKQLMQPKQDISPQKRKVRQDQEDTPQRQTRQNQSSQENSPERKNKSNKYGSQNSLKGSLNNIDSNSDVEQQEQTENNTTSRVTFKNNKSQADFGLKSSNIFIDQDFQRRMERRATKQVPLKIKLFQLINYVLKKQAEKAKKGGKKTQVYKQQNLIDLKNSLITVERNKEGTGFIRKIEASKLFQRATDKLQVDDTPNKK